MRVNFAVSGIGTIRATYTDDWDTGATTYTVTGPRVSGAYTVTLNPHGRGAELDPDTPYLMVAYGRGDFWMTREEDRPDRPRINGVELVGGAGVDVDQMRSRRLTGWNVPARRRTGPTTTREVPAATQDRNAAVVEAVVTHWVTRPDSLALRLASIRHQAARLGPQLEHQITVARERVAEALAELERLQDWAAAAAETAAMPPGAIP